MNSKRLFRLAVITGAVAAGVATVRALKRDDDPLPSPAAGPSEPWPPLRAATGVVAEPEPPAAPALADAVKTTEDAADQSEAEAEPIAAKSAPKRRRAEPLRATWMPPQDDGSCPDGYPLKANDQSKIFHAPGQMSYDRTVPERCYADPEAAIADGYRAAKR